MLNQIILRILLYMMMFLTSHKILNKKVVLRKLLPNINVFFFQKIIHPIKIDKVQKDVQSAYDARREELSVVEEKLRKQKDALDEERNQLTLDKIQYESDKNELA